MKLSKLTAALLLLVSVLGGSSVARAVTIVNSSYLLGTVVDGTPSSSDWELVYINTLIGQYNANPADHSTTIGGHAYTVNAGAFVPAPDLDLLTDADLGLYGTSKTLDVTGATWLLAKWGQDDAIYYVAGLTSIELQLDGVFPARAHGLSHTQLFGASPSKVPDTGSTALFLGVSLLALSRVRRR